jgi:hypothetical protein
LFDGLNSQFVWQMASILNLYTIIIDSNANGTTCIMEHPVTKGVCKVLYYVKSATIHICFLIVTQHVIFV